MVLAVNVHRDGAADGCEAGTGHDRRQPSPRRENAGQIAQGRAGLEMRDPALFVERKDPIEPRHVDGRPAVVQAGIPVRAAIADCRSGAFGKAGHDG